MTATAIEWTDEVWNPVTGCSHVSEGCRFCYAEREWKRLSANPKTVYHGRKFTDVQCHEDRLLQPLAWKKPRMVFVNSMSDLFHPDVPFEFIDKVFAVIALAEKHTFQVLTKRPERALEYFNNKNIEINIGAHAVAIAQDSGKPLLGNSVNWLWPLPNVWLGVSVEDQKTADRRIGELLKCPAAVRFVSYEPGLGPVDFNLWTGCAACGQSPPLVACADPVGLPLCDDCAEWADGPVTTSNKRLDWIIAGGESGPKARPSHPGWFRQVRDQCAAADIPYFHKQNGEWAMSGANDDPDIAGEYLGKENSYPVCWVTPGGEWAVVGDNHEKLLSVEGVCSGIRVGKKKAGRLLDGVEHNGMPGK